MSISDDSNAEAKTSTVTTSPKTPIKGDDDSLPTTVFLIAETPDNSNSCSKPWLKNAKLASCFSVFLLCFLNCFNYVNRYTLPPVVGRLKIAFDLSDQQLGLIQACFDLVYVATSPLFGYLGDRLNRRYILTATLLVANACGLASSFVPEGYFWLLLITRALLGMAEAAYSNIGPVIIADMFVGKMRTLVFTLFQFAIPIGCGFGYIIASLVVDYLDDWRWAFRLTPLPIAVTVLVLFLFVREPRRGEAENAAVGDPNYELRSTTSFLKDLSFILRIPSFSSTTFAFVAISFAFGSLSYWTPYTINLMTIMTTHESREAEINFMFGIIALLSGLSGVVIGALASGKWLKPKCGPAADGIVCGVAMLIGAPFIYVAITCVGLNMLLVTWATIFVGNIFLSSCWVPISDITMSVVVPTRRATATSFMAAISHLLGDAASPYVMGLISDFLRSFAAKNDQPGSINLMADFTSIHHALLLSPIVIALSGGVFLIGSLFLKKDADKAKNAAAILPMLGQKEDEL